MTVQHVLVALGAQRVLGAEVVDDERGADPGVLRDGAHGRPEARRGRSARRPRPGCGRGR